MIFGTKVPQDDCIFAIHFKLSYYRIRDRSGELSAGKSISGFAGPGP
jgi:hypothetical protein